MTDDEPDALDELRRHTTTLFTTIERAEAIFRMSDQLAGVSAAQNKELMEGAITIEATATQLLLCILEMNNAAGLAPMARTQGLADIIAEMSATPALRTVRTPARRYGRTGR